MNIKNYFRKVIVLFALGIILTLLLSLQSSLNAILALSFQGNSFEVEYTLNKIKDVESKNHTPELAYLELNNKLPLNQNINLAFGEENNWYLIRIKNHTSTPKDIVFFIDNPMLDIIEVYDVDDKFTLMTKMGDISEVPNHLKATPNFEANVNANNSREFIVKTNTFGSPNFPLLVFEKNNFERYKSAVYLIWGTFIGITILISVYNLVLYAGSKDYIYLVYVSYVTLFLIVLSVLHGFGWLIFPSGLMHSFSDNLIFFYHWLGISLALFTYYFLNIHNIAKSKLRLLTRVLVTFIGLLSITSLFLKEYESAKLFFPLQAVIYLVCIAMLVDSAKGNLKWVNFYVLSWFPLLISAAFGTMLMLGKIDYSFWTRHATMLGVMFEIMFISLALAQKLRNSEEELFYDNTHDRLTRLPNLNAVNHYLQLTNNNLKAKTLLFVSIAKIKSNTLIKTNEEYVDFYCSIGRKVGNELRKDLLLLSINEKNSDSTFYYNSDTLLYIVISNDDMLLENTINKLFNENHEESGENLKHSDIKISALPFFSNVLEKTQVDEYLDFLKVNTASNLRIFDDEKKQEFIKYNKVLNSLQGQLDTQKVNIEFSSKGTVDDTYKIFIPTIRDNEGLSFSYDEFIFYAKKIGAVGLAEKLFIKEIMNFIHLNTLKTKIGLPFELFVKEGVLCPTNLTKTKFEMSWQNYVYIVIKVDSLFNQENADIIQRLIEYQIEFIVDVTNPGYLTDFKIVAEKFKLFRLRDEQVSAYERLAPKARLFTY